MFWTADYSKRRRLVRLLRTNPPLLNWCMRRYGSLSDQYRHAATQAEPV